MYVPVHVKCEVNDENGAGGSGDKNGAGDRGGRLGRTSQRRRKFQMSKSLRGQPVFQDRAPGVQRQEGVNFCRDGPGGTEGGKWGLGSRCRGS